MRVRGELWVALCVTLTLLLACERSAPQGSGLTPRSRQQADPRISPGQASERERLKEERESMVWQQIGRRGVTAPRVLEAMSEVPRHLFVPQQHRSAAYGDHPLPIGHAQTISQPYIVAFMSEALDVRPGDRVLEVGTGSGYQTAVLVALGAEVYTIEIVAPLFAQTVKLLEQLKIQAHTRLGDGYAGWPEAAPFDRIMVTAAPPRVPPHLLEQLVVGGKMVIPVGDERQELKVIHRTADGYREEPLLAVRFVPMTGEIQR